MYISALPVTVCVKLKWDLCRMPEKAGETGCSFPSEKTHSSWEFPLGTKQCRLGASMDSRAVFVHG